MNQPLSHRATTQQGILFTLAVTLLATAAAFAAADSSRSQPVADATTDARVAGFRVWAENYRNSGRRTFADASEASRVEQLARERAAAMRLLMARDPDQFLQLVLPDETRLVLPQAIHPWLERRVKSRGSFELSCVLTDPESHYRGAEHQPHASYVRHVRLNGATYEAFVSRNWKNQQTVQEAIIEGIVLGDAILLADAPTSDEQAANGQPVISDAPNPGGANTLLYIIARFSDESANPIDDAVALNQMGVINNFWLDNSGGATSIRGLVNSSQVMDIVHVVLPQPTNYAPTYNSGFTLLLNDARNAAAALGYDYADYNLDVIVTANPGSAFLYAGRGFVGSQGLHLVRPFTTLRTAGHELAHNLGLFHANYWRTDSVQPFARDSVPGGYCSDTVNAEWVEYGHYFSIMAAQSGGELEDPTKPHYAPAEKAHLGWLSGPALRFVSTSSTNRVFRHDHRDTTGTPRAIRIETPATDYTGYGRRYWLSYRYAPWNTASSWFRNGIQIDVAQPSYGFDGATLLDMTPYSRDASSPFFNPVSKPSGWWTIDNTDKLDGALIVGRTYSDTDAGIHITPVGTGSNSVNEEYIDVVIHLGSFQNNRPPVIAAFTASATQVATNQSANFSVTATDPDGDALAYSWDFDQVQVFTASGLNSPTATKSWPSAGQYRVTVTVSDMKGGIASESIITTVGAPPSDRQIWGRVVWGGLPVYGARVWTTGGSTVYQAWSDSDGSYALTDLPSTDNYTVRCMRDGLTFAAQFSNPVSITSSDAFGRDFYANERLPGSGGLITYVVSGQITYAGDPAPGVEVRAGGLLAVTDTSGTYRFTNFPSGAYTITPRKQNWTFSPAARTVTISSANSSGNNFSRVAPHSISGRIDGLPAGAQDTAPDVFLSNGRSVRATRQGTGGNRYWGYTLTDVPTGEYSVSAELPGFQILPSGFANPLTVSADLANINFTGTSSVFEWAIDGCITERGMPLPGVTVAASLGGVTQGSATTDADGCYRIVNLNDGLYTIAPARAGYTFSPTSSNGVYAGSSGISFTATGPTAPPAIASVSASPTVVPDSTSTTILSAAASGTAPLSYSWDALIGNGPVVFSTNDSSSASSTTASFQAPGSYRFRLRVTDANSLSTTSTVNVTVSAGPFAMVVAPYEVQVAAGESVTFRADAWDQLGSRLTVTPTWSVSGGGTISTGGLFSATTVGGPYAVRALAGSLSATGFVWVTQAPITPVEIVQHPQSQIVNITSNATFTVMATGTSPLAYQWFHSTLNPQPSTNLLLNATNTTLIISNVQDSHAGFYSVVVSNGPSVTSSNAQLIVNHLPVPASPVLHRYPSSGLKVRALVLLGTDSDGNSLFLNGVNSPTDYGATVSTNNGWVFYTPPPGMTNNDSFNYTVADGWGGFSMGTATILVLSNAGPSLSLTWQDSGDGTVRIAGDGIPDRTYILEFTESLETPNWQPLDTVTADPNGRFEYLDQPPPTAPSRFYRLTTN